MPLPESCDPPFFRRNAGTIARLQLRHGARPDTGAMRDALRPGRIGGHAGRIEEFLRQGARRLHTEDGFVFRRRGVEGYRDILGMDRRRWLRRTR